MGQDRQVIRCAGRYTGIILQNELWGYSVMFKDGTHTDLVGKHFDLVYSDGTHLLCDFPSFTISGKEVQRWSIEEKPIEGKPAA